MAKLSELLIATLATAALVACGDDTSTSDKSDTGVGAGGQGAGGEGTGGGVTGGEATGGTPTGGTPTGGTPTGGTPTGGTPTGGTPTGGTGGGEGGALPPPPEGCQDGDAVCVPGGPSQAICDAEPCTWTDGGEWAPAARVSWINVPANPMCGAEVGCRLFGTSNGTALAGLLPLLNPDAPQPQPGECGDSGLSAYVQPDEAGEIQLKLLSILAGAMPGEVFGSTGDIDLQLFTGDAAGADWTVDPVSFVPGSQDPLIHFPGASIAANGLLHTPASRFALTLPVQGLPIALALEASQVTGYVGIGAGGLGYKLTDGLIGGYLPKDSIVGLLSGLQAACAAANPPSFCGTLNGILPPGSCTPENCDAGIGLISSFLGGFDSKVGGDGAASECNPQTPDDCNAIGVCLQVEMEGVNITGVTAAQ